MDHGRLSDPDIIETIGIVDTEKLLQAQCLISARPWWKRCLRGIILPLQRFFRSLIDLPAVYDVLKRL